VVNAQNRSAPEIVATGIEVAVGAGAQVIALGDHADTDDPVVAQMIARAVGHDVLVVAPAGEAGSAREGDGVLRVAGVGPDDRPLTAYPAGSVEVRAPGVDVATLGVRGTGVRTTSGTAYAVAYVAGAAALVRGGDSGLNAADVERRLLGTASEGSRSSADPAGGYGMLDPRAAVGADVPAPATSTSSWPQLALLIGMTTVLGAVGLTVWRRLTARHRVRTPGA
jgi:hypothetical protein